MKLARFSPRWWRWWSLSPPPPPICVVQCIHYCNIKIVRSKWRIFLEPFLLWTRGVHNSKEFTLLLIDHIVYFVHYGLKERILVVWTLEAQMLKAKNKNVR